VHAARVSSCQCATDLVAPIPKDHDDVIDAGVLERIEHVFDDRAAAELQQRLRCRRCKRVQPAAVAGGENHCLHIDPHTWARAKCARD
jgi:hypothetical protein